MLAHVLRKRDGYDIFSISRFLKEKSISIKNASFSGEKFIRQLERKIARVELIELSNSLYYYKGCLIDKSPTIDIILYSNSNLKNHYVASRLKSKAKKYKSRN